ncbi:VOC family protein [Gottfriedia luciferensis]|uniref:VOC family protein n=1 Tax=Gottfriedia luciferensis TaxID=178774 RepID=UPI000B448F2D|nr:VOC family protein [Gottfriedia luciferensis]
MSNLFKRIDTVFLQVTDFENAVEWYCSVLGFTVRWNDVTNGYATLNIGETPLTLVRKNEQEVGHTNKHMQFNFYTSDIEKAYQHLVQHDVKVEKVNQDGTFKWFEFYDLDGNRLGVCSFPE